MLKKNCDVLFLYIVDDTIANYHVFVIYQAPGSITTTPGTSPQTQKARI